MRDKKRQTVNSKSLFNSRNSIFQKFNFSLFEFFYKTTLTKSNKNI